MKRANAKKKDVLAKSIKSIGADVQGPDGHLVFNSSETLKPLDRAVADAKLYDDMERNFERVTKLPP